MSLHIGSPLNKVGQKRYQSSLKQTKDRKRNIKTRTINNKRLTTLYEQDWICERIKRGQDDEIKQQIVAEDKLEKQREWHPTKKIVADLTNGFSHGDEEH